MKTKTGKKSADFGNDTINYSGSKGTQVLKSMLRRKESRLDCLETRFSHLKPSESSSVSGTGECMCTKVEACS